MNTFIQSFEGRTMFSAYSAGNVAELIAAVNAANQTPEADTITLAPGSTFVLTAVDHNNPDGDSTGLPAIVAAGGRLTIDGGGDTVERSTAAGTPNFRLFEVKAGAALTLRNLTIQGGRAVAVFGGAGSGGGVLNYGTLSFDAVTIQNNTAEGGAGFVGHFGDGDIRVPGGTGFGGGLFSDGPLTMTNCTVRNNSVTGGRGGDSAPRTVGKGGTRLGATDGGDGRGGGVYVQNAGASIRGSVITANTAQGGAGGSGGSAQNGKGFGGGIYISSGAPTTLDAYTVDHTVGNITSGRNGKDIFGSYTSIV